ncbi:hypothetical protein PG988_011375 [Apiospora saccharicola]
MNPSANQYEHQCFADSRKHALWPLAMSFEADSARTVSRPKLSAPYPTKALDPEQLVKEIPSLKDKEN